MEHRSLTTTTIFKCKVKHTDTHRVFSPKCKWKSKNRKPKAPKEWDECILYSFSMLSLPFASTNLTVYTNAWKGVLVGACSMFLIRFLTAYITTACICSFAGWLSTILRRSLSHSLTQRSSSAFIVHFCTPACVLLRNTYLIERICNQFV